MAEKTATPSTNDERAQRRARRQALIDAGVQPYPIHSTVTAHAADLEERYAELPDGTDTEDVYSLTGRIRAFRKQGKAAFIVLEDCTAQIQLFCRVNDLPEDEWALLGQLDLGDIIGATGAVLRTRRGQLSIAPTHVELLSKSLRPLPEKFHGLTDREVRYRQRYVDLIMNPEVRDTFRKRSQIISLIRRYMEADGYMEVETPMMHAILGGANAKPFVTHFNALDRDFYLRIATELPLKRCIVGGLERVFEIGRQFRNEGMDLTHNPEFTSMEAYCAYSDLDGMKELTQGLFKTIAREVCGCEEGHEVITYQGPDRRHVRHLGPLRLPAPAACTVDMDTPSSACAGSAKARYRVAGELGRRQAGLRALRRAGRGHAGQPDLRLRLPRRGQPLSKRKDDDPRLTDRFELVICGHAYANAFSELNDPVDQAGRFAEQVAAKGFGDDEAMGYDYDYVRALEYGMPPAGGIGYGIDRMIMLFCDAPAIRERPSLPADETRGHHPRRHCSSAARDHRQPASVDALADDARHGASNEAAAAHADAPALETGLTRDQAFDLLKKYNEDPFHIAHGQTLEGLMRYYAQKPDPANVEFWGQVGLLHDLDWEKFQDEVQHTVKAAELIEEAGGTRELARAIRRTTPTTTRTFRLPSCKMGASCLPATSCPGSSGRRVTPPAPVQVRHGLR